MSGTTPKTKSTKKPAKVAKNRFKPDKPTIKKVAIWLVAIIVLLGVYELGRQGGLWGAPDALRLIRSEKIARKDLLGLKLISSEERGVNSLIRKTVTPSIENTFKPIDGDVDKTIEKIVQYAKADGWVYDDSYVADIWIGRKHPRKNIELVLSVEKYKGNIILSIGGYENRR